MSLWAGDNFEGRRTDPDIARTGGEKIGLREEEEGLFAVYCGRIFLAWLEDRTNTFPREDRAERWAKKETAA